VCTLFTILVAHTDSVTDCLQDFLRYNVTEFAFPFIPKKQREGYEWMTDQQEKVTNLYGWTAVAVMGLVAGWLAFQILNAIRSMFYDSYTARGKDMGIDFSNVRSISAYIPQVESTVFSYPLLACNVDSLDEELFEWNDPDRPMSFYDLTKDAEVLLSGIDVSGKKVFSHIKHWSPQGRPKDA
jgi:hypothetical protein